jgi:hypothetical protein
MVRERAPYCDERADACVSVKLLQMRTCGALMPLWELRLV